MAVDARHHQEIRLVLGEFSDDEVNRGATAQVANDRSVFLEKLLEEDEIPAMRIRFNRAQEAAERAVHDSTFTRDTSRSAIARLSPRIVKGSINAPNPQSAIASTATSRCGSILDPKEPTRRPPMGRASRLRR